jgi:hypothetical protein
MPAAFVKDREDKDRLMLSDKQIPSQRWQP